MKSIVKYLPALLAGIVLASCAKENEKPESPEKDLIRVAVRANVAELSPETKTSLADNGDLYWSYEDEISVFDGVANRYFLAEIESSDEPTKSTTFTGEVSSSADSFVAIYPYDENAVYNTSGVVTTTLPTEQAAVENSFANKANVTVATGDREHDNMDGHEDYAVCQFSFKNIGALVKFTISQGDTHQSVSVKVKNQDGTFAPIAGVVEIVPATAEATVVANGGADMVTVKAASGKLAEGDYYAVILPITGENKKLSFVFSDGHSTKTRTTKVPVTVARSSYIDMGTIDESITYPDPYEGEWVIAGTHQNTDLVLKKYVSGNYYPADEASIVNGVLTVNGSKANYKVTIAKENDGEYEGMYTIKDAGDLYLTAYSTSNNLKGVDAENLDVGSYWDISEESDALKIVASRYNVNNAKNHLRVNNNNGSAQRFSCYAESSSQPTVSLYRYADVVENVEPAANPTISCSHNTITITCATEGATIYYTIGADENSTPDPTDESDVYDPDDKPTISEGDGYVKAFAIADGYSESDVVGTEVIYVAPSAETYYEKVTSAPSDWSGTYLMVCENASENVNKVLSSISTTSTKYGIGADVTISNNQIVSSETVDEYQIIIEEATDNGTGYLLNFLGGLLNWSSGNSLSTNISESNNTRWTISAGETAGNWIIANVADSNREIWYNTGSPRFACYTGKDESSSGYAPIQLYKYVDAPDTRDPAPIAWKKGGESVSEVNVTWSENGFSTTLPTLDAAGLGEDITYSSTATSVAEIDADGVVTIVGGGSTVIKATYTADEESTYKTTTVSYTLTVTDSRPTVATPTFSPVAGTVAAGTQISISCETQGATIHYTDDGSVPTAESPAYTMISVITINEATTIKAIAVKANCKTSAVATAAYSVGVANTSTEENPYTAAEADALAGQLAENGILDNVYVSGIISEITDAYNATYHNVSFNISADGLTTSTQLLIFRAAATSADDFKVGDAIEYKGRLINFKGNNQPTTTHELQANQTGAELIYQIKAPSFSPNGGLFSGSQSVTLTADADATIRYTLDGTTDPTATAGQQYNGPFSITETTTVKAIAIKNGINTGVVEATFTKETPTFGASLEDGSAVTTKEVAATVTTATVYVTGNVAWTATPGTGVYFDSGLSVTSKSGTGATSFAIYFAANDDENNTKDNTVTIATSESISPNSIPLTVTQAKATSGGGDNPQPVEKEYSFAFSVIGTEGWSNSYADHNNVYDDDVVSISLKSCSKQTGTITEYPVTKAGDVIVVLKDGTMSAVTFSLSKWTTKDKTVSLQYSTDGGATYKALSPAVSSSTFTLTTESLPSGTNAVKMVQGNTGNQVGLKGVSFTYTPSN